VADRLFRQHHCSRLSPGKDLFHGWKRSLREVESANKSGRRRWSLICLFSLALSLALRDTHIDRPSHKDMIVTTERLLNSEMVFKRDKRKLVSSKVVLIRQYSHLSDQSVGREELAQILFEVVELG
jgi:hypothetical protein